MDHKKIVASALGMSIVLALVFLGTGNAAAVGNSTNRWVSPLASAGGSGGGPNGGNDQTAKPPIQPDGSISARPNVTVSLGLWRNMRPTESMLNGVSLLPSSYSVDCQSPDQMSEGWAVGNNGVILGYCNGVWDHAIIPQYNWTDLYGVQAISPTMAVAVGAQGAILAYQYDITQNGWQWIKLPTSGISQRLNRVSLAKRNDGSYFGWAVGYEDPDFGNRGTLVQATIHAPTGAPNPTSDWDNVTGVYPLPAVRAYYGVQTLTPTDAWAVGSVGTTSGIIIHWDGSQWSMLQAVDDPLYGIGMRSATEGWAVGRGGAIYRFNGSSWSKVASPTTKDLGSVGFAPNGEQWIFGSENAQLKYVNGVWEHVQLQNIRTDTFDIRAVDFTSGHGWLVGGHYSNLFGGHILEYDNGLWLAVTPPTDNRLNAVDSVSENDAWAVGAADSSGGTIIHWDGKHWQRWYQPDLPIPAADLYTVSMVSATDGWAAGDTLDGMAVFLHWDGKRWAKPRYDSPATKRINALDTFKTSDLNYPVFAWAVADSGDAFAKYQTYDPDYWVSLSSCQGAWYQVFGVSMITGLPPGPGVWGQPGDWDAWAVGRRRLNTPNYDPKEAVFLRFKHNNDYCGTESKWGWYQNAPGDANATRLYGIKMIDGPWGFAVGNQSDRASIYSFTLPTWVRTYLWPSDNTTPSNFYSVDIINSSQIAWFGGFYKNPNMGNKKWANISYIDADGFHWARYSMYPVNGININHRPISSISMVSDSMGWAVGDPEDTTKKSVIFQYPFPNFTLDTHPPERAILPTGSATFTVTVNAIGGIGTDVSLSFPNGLPAWAAATTIDPGTIDRRSIATITVRTSGAPVPPDPLHPDAPYCLVLRGSATFRSGDVILPIARDVCLNLYITNRPVNSVSPDHGPYGTQVTITGSGFGSDPGTGNRSTATNHVSWGNVQMPDSAVLSWSNTQITFRPPDTPGLFTDFPIIGSVKVTAGGSDSNSNHTFKMDPWISNISTSAGAGIINVTLTGTSFGNDPGPALRSTDFEHVSLNGSRIAFANVTSWSNHSIVFTVPLSSTGGTVMVTTNGFDSNTVGFGSGAVKEYLPLIKK